MLQRRIEKKASLRRKDQVLLESIDCQQRFKQKVWVVIKIENEKVQRQIKPLSKYMKVAIE